MFNKLIPQETVHLSNGAVDLYSETYTNVVKAADRVFGYLFLVEWAMGILFAFLFSPLSWTSGDNALHFHVYAAIFFGAVLSVYPAYRNFTSPGNKWNRYVGAVAQMGFSALFVHVSGGRIEAHFHIFGSLAFLAFYRDARVLILASLVTAIDHFVMGVVAPMSIYGTITATPWRAVEHSLWVVFEDVFLIASIRGGLLEMKKLAQIRFELQSALAQVEKLAAERAAELSLSKETIIEQQKDLMASLDTHETVGLTLVQDLIERAVSYRESRLQAEQISCSFDLMSNRVYVNGRASELSQAIVNLLDRSIESTVQLKEKHLKISVSRAGPNVQIAIESNGPAASSLEGLDLAVGSIKAHAGQLQLHTANGHLHFTVTLPNALGSERVA